jgi:hypothetical protein
MDLSAAHSFLATNSSADNAKWFRAAFEHSGKDDAFLLDDYLAEIAEDPEAWVRALPANVKAKSTMNKPKTAIMALLSKEGAAEKIDEVVRADVKQKLDKTYKNKAFIDSVLKERSGGGDSDSVTDPGDDVVRALQTDAQAHVVRIGALEAQVAMLKKALASCCKNTDFGDTICILLDAM